LDHGRHDLARPQSKLETILAWVLAADPSPYTQFLARSY
jgi:hypothetical protein